MFENYTSLLKDCIVRSEVENVFKGKAFPNKYASAFESEVIEVVASDLLPSKKKVNITGLLELGFRVILFLKLDGKLNGLPQNSGENSYFLSLHSVLSRLSKDKTKITSLSDINSDDIDMYIDEYWKKERSPVTINGRLNKLQEWIKQGNQYLPYFLQLDESLLKNSRNYQLLREQVRDIKANQAVVGSARAPYPLYNLKKIMENFIETIELYSEEILKIAKLHVDTKDFTNTAKYKSAYDYFKNSEFEFTEPTLKVIHKKVLNSKGYYLGKGDMGVGHSVKSLRDTIFEAVNKLEVSCGSVILLLTGMRAGEFSTLDRNIVFEEDEHFNLTRMVYKTASTPEGEPLEMPIPPIVKKALEVLSELAKLKDGKEEGAILLNTIEEKESKNGRSERISNMMERFVKPLGIDTPPTLHQLRHAMAFLIVHLNENDGLELARMFLGHKSITMTLQYMGHYNNELRQAIEELKEEESEILVEAISNEIQNNKRLFGEKGKRLLPTNKFVGKQASEFIVLLKKGLLKLIEDKKIAIIQTPVCLCIHDLDKHEDMACQRGFDIMEIAKNGQPFPSRCEGAKCGNAIFLEEHLEGLGVYDGIDTELKARLEENTYFMDSGGFENDSFRRIVKEYQDYKQEGA